METVYRNIELDYDARADRDTREIPCVVSTDAPYDRGDWVEVLVHDSEDNIDLSRAPLPLIEGHQAEKTNIGSVDRLQVCGGRLRGIAKFGNSARAKELLADIKDGIVRSLSIGYRILKFEEAKNDVIRVTKFMPLETSVVACPADINAGFFRALNIGELKMTESTKKIEPKEGKRELEAERERVECIMSMAEGHDMKDIGIEAVRNGTSYEQFNRELLGHIEARNSAARSYGAASPNRAPAVVTRRGQELTLRGLIVAAAGIDGVHADIGPYAELSREVEIQTGERAKHGGYLIPVNTRDLTAGTATDGAELVATNLLAGNFVDVLRNAAVVTRAGATILPGLVGNVGIPRKTSGATAAWISTEDGDASNSDPQFDQISMAPKTVACYTQFTRQLILQSTPAIEQIVRDDLAQAAAQAIDLAALYGSGASGQPEGVANVTGINTVTLAAADPTWPEVNQIVRTVDEDNALMGRPAWIFEANGREALATTEKASGTAQFILNEGGQTVAGFPYHVSNQVVDEDYFFGNWNDLLIGQWGGLELLVDPYTHSLKGKVRVVMFNSIDIAVRHPESFCHANDGA